jgi:hypothetical protein
MMPGQAAIVYCQLCKMKQVSPEMIDPVGNRDGELWDKLVKSMEGTGWIFPVHPSTGKRVAVCPNCSKNLHELPDYDAKAVCPKCNCEDVETAYCGGRVNQCLIEREHIHRKCTRCGFAFLQGCADLQVSWWRRIFKRKGLQNGRHAISQP